MLYEGGKMLEYVPYIVIALLILFILQRVLPVKGVRNISTTDVQKILSNKQLQFVDVRTPEEFRGNHIKGFKNIPLHELAKKAEKELSKDKEVILICQSGMRSRQASKLLKKMGFLKVTNIRGGVSAFN